jgi:L-amino acid N-acyltransferase YncA
MSSPEINPEINTRIASAMDAEAIARIYSHHIRTGVATFEESEVSTQEMAGRMAKVAELSLPWLVAESRGEVIGYAYAGKWRERSAYRFAAESSVYLDPLVAGKGIGTRLYRDLLQRLRAQQFLHTVIGGISQPNAASVALHERLGFTKVAHFKEVGFKFGRWIDVAYWQLQL